MNSEKKLNPNKNVISAKMVKKLRLDSGLTQGQFGTIIGRTRQYVNRLESDKGQISLDQAFVIANFFDLPIEHIFSKQS